MEFEHERERSRGLPGGGEDGARVPGRATQVEAERLVGAAASGAASNLPAPLQRKFEASLGTDLSSVAVHHDGAAAAAANAVGAQAYALGQHIYFSAGRYDPASEGGQHLIAHEVAHTVQQRGGTPARQHKLAVSSAHDAAEHEADRAADAMVRGAPARVGSVVTGIHRFPLDNPAPELQLGDVRRVVAVSYPGALLGACPSLPRRTSNPVFAQLASTYRDYDAAKRQLDKQLPQLTALLAYTPDVSSSIQALKTEAQTEGSLLRTQAQALNDRRAKLGEIRSQAAEEVATLTAQTTAMLEHRLIILAQKDAIAMQWTTLRQQEEARAKLDSISPSIGDMINGIGSLGGLALGAANVVSAEVIKIGTSLAIKDPQMANGGAQRTAAADIAGQGSANIVGFLASIVDEISGVAGQRRQLDSMIKRFTSAMAKRQLQIDCMTLMSELSQLQLIENTVAGSVNRLKRLGNDYQAQLRAVAQSEQNREGTIDARTGGKLKDLTSHIAACRDVEAAAAGICDSSLIGLGGKGPLLVNALDAVAAVPPTPSQAPPPPRHNPNPFNDPDAGVDQLPPRPAQTAPASEDPVPGALAGEAKTLSGTVQATIATADGAQKQAHAKRDDLTATASRLVGATEVDDPRLP